jgi:hypothetical protein
MYKILGTDNKEYGPVPAEQVRQWIVERRLHAQSLVLAEGTTSWKTISLFPEFSATLASAPLPPMGAAVPRPDYVSSTGNNQLAVWSLVCGCVGLVCCQPASIAGLVMGIVALGQLKSNPQQEGRGMAIAGIVLGCLGLVTLVLMIALGTFGAILDGLGK